jgi:hypothetical protein
VPQILTANLIHFAENGSDLRATMKDKPHNRESSQNKRSRPEKGAEKKNANLPENEKERTDERLDEGVEETFPASAPVSVRITK